MLTFGVMFDPVAEAADWSRFAEERGFEYIYFIDSPVRWREMTPFMTLAALNTKKAKIGACVTNPVSRNPVVTASSHAALHELSGGRALIGLGKGDSALRTLGERPARLKAFQEKALFIQRLANGETVDYTPQVPAHEQWHAQGSGAIRLQLQWAPKQHIPLYIAGYSPKVMRWAGAVADGVFLQIADPDTIAWCTGNIRAGAAKAGRDPRAIDIVCAAPTAVNDDLHAACDAVRGFPAYVSNHVVDMLNYYDRSEFPESLLKSLAAKQVYDYREHTSSHAEHSGSFPDDVVESFTIVGSAERCANKIKLLESLGVTQIGLYFFGEPDQTVRSTIRTYADQIMPRVR
ncbi:MAG: LLM class flavin-dependent oxidoreductase [Candidatus Binatia bacterium]